MTKTQFRSKVKQLKKEVNRLIDNRTEKILRSGCVDLNDYENNFVLPKIFMSAMGDEIKWQLKPLDKNHIKVRNNMVHFL